MDGVFENAARSALCRKGSSGDRSGWMRLGTAVAALGPRLRPRGRRRAMEHRSSSGPWVIRSHPRAVKGPERMYIPEAFREDRPEALQALIREHCFGTLVSRHEGERGASHVPLLLDRDHGPHGTLLGHMARANPQWQGFREGEEVLAIFQGPHAYVSPSWYETELSVPTWNYAVVHACG